MMRREQLVEKLKTDLDRWNAHAAAWETRTRAARADARVEYEKRMAAFRAQRARSLHALRELRGSSAGAWHEVSHGAEEAWRRMRDAFEQARHCFERPQAAPGADQGGGPIRSRSPEGSSS